jgi:hypothetical protein
MHPESLDLAWSRVLIALPDNHWTIHGLGHRPGLRDDERWEASAWGKGRGERVYAYGPTPSRALNELADVLEGLQ